MNNTDTSRLRDKAFRWLGVVTTVSCVLILAIFIGFVLYTGVQRLSLDFLMSLPSRFAEQSGIYTAWIGTLWIFGFTALIAFPLGIGGGIYLEEYVKGGLLSSFLEINIANLAGVPSVIYGLLGLEVFVRIMQMGNSILAGSLTLA